MTLTDGSEVYICLILTVEFVYDYWWNSRENRMKRRKKNEKALGSTQISHSGGKKDLALGSSAQNGTSASFGAQGSVGLRAMQEGSNTDKLHNPQGPESPKD